jgi:NitT/TauT family transport system substrate-binding protein
MSSQAMDRRRILAVGGAAFLGLLNGACRNRRSTLDPIRISASPTLSMASLYLAQESGYFEQAGLAVELQEIRDPRLTLPMLAAGKLDVSFTAFAPTVVNAIAKGARLRLVAGREIASSTCGDFGAIYTTRRRHPRGDLDFRWLKGKSIAVRHTTGIGQFALEMELKSVNLPASAVSSAAYAEAEAMAALLGGHVDGVMSQGNIDRGHAALSRLVRTPGLGQVLPSFQYSHTMFGARLLDAPVDLGARFLAACLRASREFLDGRTPRFMQEFAKANNLDFERVRSYCRGTFTPDGAIDFESAQRFQDWAVTRGFCEKRISREQAVDERFLEAARQRLRAAKIDLIDTERCG